jgi:hypothetical protein
MPAVITPAIGNGRGITNYMTKCELNTSLQRTFNVSSESEYRKMLQAQPREFAKAVSSFVPFDPYWSVQGCPINRPGGP